MSDLPKGWESIEIEQVFESFSGGTPNRSNKAFWGGDIPWVSSGDVKTDRLYSASEMITEEGLSNSSAKLCQPNSVIIVVRSGVLKHTLPVAIAERQLAINQDIKCFDSGNADLNKWLFYSLKAYAKDILSLNREGTTVQSVKYETLKQFKLKIPPIGEQKRIIEKLEKLFGKVESVQSRLGKIPAIVKRFRQAVLAAACLGKLTADWRMNHNSDCLSLNETISKKPAKLPSGYQRLSKKAFKIVKIDHSAQDLPNKWTAITIGDLYKLNILIDFADGNHGSLYPRKEEFGETGSLFLTATQIGENWELKIQECPRLNAKTASLLTKGWARNGDVILTHNATVGRVAMLERLEEEVLLGTSATFYRFNENYVLPQFAKILFSSVFFQEQLQVEMEQTTRNQIPITKQVSLHFICPPVEEQKEIVRLVEELFRFADQIEARYKKARSFTDKLAQSILAKAFRGELVPQDPTDEPASVLLERVRAERTKNNSGKNQKPKGKAAAQSSLFE